MFNSRESGLTEVIVCVRVQRATVYASETWTLKHLTKTDYLPLK